ncbi:MAG: ABC transporter substrate-binding protein [Rhodobacteraceae bacterium]|nr:ABC transporter substrate-binding protein [Paracoccaceae bacterium]
MNKMKSITQVGIAATLALGLSSQAAVAQDRDFTIASWGGSYQEGQRDIFFGPFGEAKGINVLEDTYLGGWAQFQAMQGTGTTPWDIVQVETAELARGCEEGLFVQLDWDRLGGQDKFIEGGTSECGMGVNVISTVIAYNADLIGDVEPTSFNDFFDLEKFPGTRGLRDEPKHSLVMALLADGVSPDDMYTVLGTPEGLDQAFAKLDTIRSEIVFWNAGAQPPERLVSGDVVMSDVYNGRITNANREGAADLRMIWENNLVYLDQWVILADSPNVETAYEFLEYYANADRQIEYSRDKLPYGPIVAEASANIPAEMAAILPAGENMTTAFFTGSPEAITFWLDNFDSVNERWNTWKSRN